MAAAVPGFTTAVVTRKKVVAVGSKRAEATPSDQTRSVFQRSVPASVSVVDGARSFS
jgi:hypothetical protein